MKTACPVTRAEFNANAKPVIIKIGDKELIAEAREFSTKSLGWYLNGKTTLLVGNQPVPVQIGMTLTVIGSKELPK